MVPKENGNMVGPTNQGTQDLIDLDPLADWDATNQQIINSCATPSNYTCAQPGYVISPRVVAVPIFDLELYMATGGPGNGTVKIVNILGFFVDRYSAGTVTGYLINKKGSSRPECWRCGRPDLVPQASDFDSLKPPRRSRVSLVRHPGSPFRCQRQARSSNRSTATILKAAIPATSRFL